MSVDGDILRRLIETDDASFGHPDAITEEALAALARLEAAAKEADRCERGYAEACDELRGKAKQIVHLTYRAEAAEAQRDALAEALRWYADPLNWPLAIDGRYDRARAALAEAGIE